MREDDGLGNDDLDWLYEEDPDEPLPDEALDNLQMEFQELALRKLKRKRDAHLWTRETRWTRLVRWLKEHPGETIELNGIHSNAVQKLKKRYPGLQVQGRNHHHITNRDGSKGKKVCTMILMWPDA